MAVIGDVLTEPEAGWKRYDDTHPAIKYEGWTYKNNSVKYIGNTLRKSGNSSDNLEFDFIGTDLRIIAETNTEYGKNIHILIDGTEHIFSENGEKTEQVIVFESNNLTDGRHTVKLVGEQSYWSNIDAIDINENGRLLHPDEVLTPDELEVGKRIRCHYTAQSGQVGTFSNLGQETYVDGINDFIPPESSATPDGDFYYICVDEYNDKKIMVADRNIQHSISWDTLNSEGIASGSGLPYTFEGYKEGFGFVVRLLTGGVDANDKDNEWDKYIVNGPYPGNLSMWNLVSPIGNWYDYPIWTSSVPSVGLVSQRVVRGYRSTDLYSFGRATTSDTVINGFTFESFRPVLEIETLGPPPFKQSFIYHKGEYKKYMQSLEGDMVKDESFTEEGTVLRYPISKYASKIEVSSNKEM